MSSTIGLLSHPQEHERMPDDDVHDLAKSENADNPIIIVSCAYEGEASHTSDQEIAFQLLYDEKGAGAEGRITLFFWRRIS